MIPGHRTERVGPLVLRRVDRLAGGVAELVDRIAVDDIDDCLRMLAASVVDVTDLLGVSPVTDVLVQWREQGRVSPTTRAQLGVALRGQEFEAFVAHRDDDLDLQRRAFQRARGLDCLGVAVDAAQPAPLRLAEAVYEAAAAMGGSAGVVAVLAEFVP